MTLRRSVIQGCGSCLPEKIVTNDDLAAAGLDTSDAWIYQRTGIRSRHVVGAGEGTSDLATRAAQMALANAGIAVSDVDAVIVATTTPECTFPATAAQVQAKLGMTRGFAFDVQAVCSGFIYALNLADNFIRLGQAQTIVVIGAEVFSRMLDWKDRSTCILFGDGAGAVVLQGADGKGTTADRGVLSTHIYCDGRETDILRTTGGVGGTGEVGKMLMDGREVFRHAVTHLSECVDIALTHNGLKPSDINWLVPHQANLRIIDSVAKKLGMTPEQVVITIQTQANTAAATIPIALTTAVQDGRIKRGDLLITPTAGAGFTWGVSLIRF